MYQSNFKIYVINRQCTRNVLCLEMIRGGLPLQVLLKILRIVVMMRYTLKINLIFINICVKIPHNEAARVCLCGHCPPKPEKNCKCCFTETKIKTACVLENVSCVIKLDIEASYGLIRQQTCL